MFIARLNHSIIVLDLAGSLGFAALLLGPLLLRRRLSGCDAVFLFAAGAAVMHVWLLAFFDHPVRHGL